MNDSTQLRDLFRSEMSDEVEPYLWSDQDFFIYLDDAQKKFCRETGGLGDASTAAVTQLVITTASDWVDTSALILKIRSAYRLSDGSPVEIINYEDMPKRSLRFDGRTGPVKFLVIGLEKNRARTYPFPSENVTLQLIVDRLPMESITDEDQTLEIDEQHCINLLMWAKYRAYNKQDAETLNVKRAAEFEMKFLTYCAEAKSERDRAKHKTRIVAYGGL